MRPVKRFGVNKRSSSAKFRSKSMQTKGINLRGMPMRGGIRL